jgi:muramoyltetrapeptide carboxypeptidase
MMRPPRMRPGDPLAIIAPSGPVPEDRFAKGRARLEARYDLRYSQRIFEKNGYLAGDDDARLRELELALEDDAIRGIICARGGYGAMRLLTKLSGESFRRHPKPIVGFSDITALHAFAYRAGVASIHGPVVTQLGMLPTVDEAALYALLEGEPSAPFSNLRSVAARTVSEGPLIGGNLEIVTRLLATPFAFALDGAILLLEEISERPYRLDRQLTQLALSGAWQRVAGVVVGGLVRCEEEGMPSATDVVIERLAQLSVPVLLGLPVGHEAPNRAVGHGVRVRIDGTKGELTPLEPCVD